VAKSGEYPPLPETTRSHTSNTTGAIMSKKSKLGRPPGKRLTKALGQDLRDFIDEELKKQKLKPNKFHEKISETLHTGFGIGNSEITVKRSLHGIYTRLIPFREEYREAITTILGVPLPVSIQDFLKGRKTRARAINGGAPSSLDTKEYFDLFFDYIKSNEQKKKVRIFARWTNLELRKIMLKFGPHDLFQRFDEVVGKGLLDVEYVFFLLSPASLKLPDVKKILKRYRQFASEIYIHYLSQTTLELKETDETISIWDGYESVFTHDWDFKGKIDGLTAWNSKDDHARLLKTYEKIKSESDFYFRRGSNPRT
jgi:hypothetical protein